MPISGLDVAFCGLQLAGKRSTIGRLAAQLDGGRLDVLDDASDPSMLEYVVGTMFRGAPLQLELRAIAWTTPDWQSFNAMQRELVLGSDAIVFVIDGQVERMEANLDFCVDVVQSLAAAGRRIADMPIVYQYNKCDLPNFAARAELDAMLNPGRCPAFETVAKSDADLTPILAALVAEHDRCTAST